MFKVVGFAQLHSEPLEWIAVTNAEGYVRGQVMTISSDLLTAGGNDSDGTQMYVMESAGTGDGNTLVACRRIQRQHKYEIEDAQVASGTYLIGTAYELNTSEIGITNTATKGVFVVDENLADGGVVGHFQTATDV